MMIEDKYFRETTVKVMKRIRKYPHMHLAISTRAALSFYEILQALTFMEARNPVLTAALITLPHRVKSESLIDNEEIIKEIIESLENNAPEQPKKVAPQSLTISKRAQILRELDNLQDMVYAMPYEIDILSPYWFKVSQETLFRVEAPTLVAYTMNENNKADFGNYRKILHELQEKKLIQLKSGNIKLTRTGTFLKYKNVFHYIERRYPNFFRTERSCLSHSGDDRKYRRGDRYKDLYVRRTLRGLVRKGKNTDHVSKEDLRIENRPFEKNCLVVLALDHSWSMARSRKLQHAKDSAAGLVLTVKKNGDRMALIAFSDEAALLSPPTKQYGLLIEKITRLRPENETDIADALMKTRMIFSTASKNLLKHSIIISDGIPTSDNQEVTRDELESRIIHEVRKLSKMGVTVSVICIRDELEENDTTLARKIAAMGRGSFSLVNAKDLLDQILRDYSNVKLRDS
jgi:Mg-chelatase subunit ChlD